MKRIKRYFGSLPLSFGWAILAAIVVTLLGSIQSYVMWMTKVGAGSALSKVVILFPALNYCVWLLVVPLLFHWMKKIHQHENSFRRNSLLATLSVGFTVGHEVLALIVINAGTYIYFLVGAAESFTPDIQSGVFGLTKSYIEFWVIYLILSHFYARKKYRQSELRNLQLESSLVQAQMSALKNQLHPHFLFNSFNTISALMEEDIPLAQRMITKLGLLLRKILKDGDVQFIPLEEEVELAKLYLEVEQIRFKGRLQTRFAIDPSLKSIPVPTLLLQPAVENAVKHGFYHKLDECEISIRAYEEGANVIIEIADNGAGTKNDTEFSFGIGLTNMRKRLETSYGEEYELNVASISPSGGFMVVVKIRKEATKNANINRPN